jgi:selenocysteine lyase/cysteine desulfurase
LAKRASSRGRVHFYAVETLERLQLADQGGLIRVGLCHYNEAREVDYLLERLRELAGQDA